MQLLFELKISTSEVIEWLINSSFVIESYFDFEN